MLNIRSLNRFSQIAMMAITFSLVLIGVQLLHAQNQDRDRDYDRITRIEPGTLLAVRTTEPIDVERRDNRVYYGTVDQDVRGDDGRLAIAQGSQVELIVRVAPDNDLVIDVDSVVVNGQRFALRTNMNRQESERDNSIVGQVMGAIQGGEVRGRAVRIPRNSVLTFRITRPLDIGIEDRGIMREGHHYHD